jgi:hypothetical protein
VAWYLDGEEGEVGRMWFVGDLLIFSLAYAGWVRIRGDHPGPSWRGEVTAGHLVGLAAVVTGDVLGQVGFRFDSQKFVDLNLYQWPECVALFALGVMASGKGWLTVVPDRLRTQSRNPALAAVGGFAVFAGFGAALGVIDDPT